ncbi:MAG: Holliday junction resolvase RuvX [Peptococcaceae bacterium]|nr:Holliday junction resolvase RuvX [Peptococcaceae bacterium]
MLGLDVGDRRIGVSSADGLGLTAQGLETFERRSLDYDLEHLTGLIRERQVKTLVVGLPKNMDGTEGPQSRKVREFTDLLLSRLEDYPAPEVVYWDERLTTVAAHRIMLEGDLSRKKRKGKVDKLAAMLILQGYLDRLAFSGKKQ